MEVGHSQGGPVERGFLNKAGEKEGFSQEGGRLASVGFSFAISNPTRT
jgi:hypothetical protein